MTSMNVNFPLVNSTEIEDDMQGTAQQSIEGILGLLNKFVKL